MRLLKSSSPAKTKKMVSETELSEDAVTVADHDATILPSSRMTKRMFMRLPNENRHLSVAQATVTAGNLMPRSFFHLCDFIVNCNIDPFEIFVACLLQ